MEWVLLWLLCGLIAAAIGSSKGEAGTGFFVGVIFGPFGILFALLSAGNRRPCPACQEKVHRKATVCPHCRTALSGN